MGTDWPTVIRAGTVSGVVGGAVSMVTARRVAEQQVAGRTAAEARQRVRGLVSPELTKLRQYQSHGYASLHHDEENLLHQYDIAFCANLFVASADLTAWLHWLVRRRLSKLSGPNTVAFCQTHGTDAAGPCKSPSAAPSGGVGPIAEADAGAIRPDEAVTDV